MQEAIELLKQEKYYLYELPTWNMWKPYNTNKFIRTDTMKALQKRGIVKISLCSGRYRMVAELIDPYYEELSRSEYCLRCSDSYESSLGRYRCRRTGKMVICTDGRATVNAMKCS